MGNPYRLSVRRKEKRVAHSMLHEGKSRVRTDVAQLSPVFTDHNVSFGGNKNSTEPFQWTLEDKELEKISTLFLSDAPATHRKHIIEHETDISGFPPLHQKQEKTSYKAEAMKDVNIAGMGEDVLSSPPLFGAKKPRKKRRLGVSNHKPIKSCEPQRRNKVVEDGIVTSSNTRSSGRRGFVDLEDGSHTPEETLSRHILQRAATFLAKLKPADRRLFWNFREVAQGTYNGKDTFKFEATDKLFRKASIKKSEGDLRGINRKDAILDAISSRQKKSSITQNDNEMDSELDTISSSEPSLVSDCDGNTEEGSEDFGGDLERVNENKGAPLRLHRDQRHNGGRLFIEDDDMWSD